MLCGFSVRECTPHEMRAALPCGVAAAPAPGTCGGDHHIMRSDVARQLLLLGLALFSDQLARVAARVGRAEATDVSSMKVAPLTTAPSAGR